MVKALTGELQGQVLKETDFVTVKKKKQTSDSVNINECK